MDFWQQFFISILGGFLSGGLIIGWIEIKRYKRENILWNQEKEKIHIHVSSAKYSIQRWSGKKTSNDEEKIRIFESGLEGNVSLWRYIIKFSLENLSNRDLLAENISFEFPPPNLLDSIKEDKKYFSTHTYPIKRRYNMFTKSILENRDFPLLIPVKSTIGIVFIGSNEYDYPNLVVDVPIEGRIQININNDINVDEKVSFVFYNSIYDEVAHSPINSDIHWVPYLVETNQINKDEDFLPF